MNEARSPLEIEAVNHPRTLFKPASWLSKIDFINHLILFNNVLVTVLSEPDGGKTSFCTLLTNNLDSEIKSISITVKAPCHAKQIIQEIATQLDLEQDTIDDLSSIAAAVNDRKSHIVLVIDDAQNLPESMINEMQTLMSTEGDFSFFHVCLISDHTIVESLIRLSESYLNNGIHTIELGPLNEAEARTYVLQRAMNGRLINKPLSDDQLKDFYQLTKGNLAQINNHLESFIHRCTTQKSTNKQLILKKTSLACAAFFTVVCSYLYYGQFKEGPNSVDKFEAEVRPHLVVSTQSIVNNMASHIPSWQESSTIQWVDNAIPKRDPNLPLDKQLSSLTTSPLIDKVVVIPAIKSEQIKQAKVSLARSKEEEVIVLESKKRRTALPSNQIKKTNSLSSAGINEYTIQIVASHNKQDVLRFRKEHHLTQNTSIRYFSNDQGSWYILTLGEFKEYRKAQQTIKQLSPQLSVLNPWVRQLSGLSNIG